jgi:glutathione synthase/RimK-type ligase-like ATP-grasp enzyme
MVLLCGIPTESPLELLTDALQEKKYPYLMLNQRRIHLSQIHLQLKNNKLEGHLIYDNISYNLLEFTGVYVRLMDQSQLPEFVGKSPQDPGWKHYDNFHQALIAWMESSDCMVVNRYSAMASNNSKPYQAQWIRDAGFFIPETLITSSPEAVFDFQAVHPEIIYKSTSGVRSIVKMLDDAGWKSIQKIRNCPVQFQEKLEGYDVRVHVVGTRCFATSVATSNVDYRYINPGTGEYTTLSVCEPSDWVLEQCVWLAHQLGLQFAGIDLRFAPDGRVYCFEVNPCPGYSYYEKNTGQPISGALASLLAGGLD